MTLYYMPPTQEDSEPVYLYDDCTEHQIILRGNYVDQKMVARIRSMIVTPRDLDRLCVVPLLQAENNNEYRNMWEGGGMITFQRTLNLTNVATLMEWWEGDTTVSPNTPIVWLPSNLPPFTEQPNDPTSMLSLNPQQWCVQECACGATSGQFVGHEDGLWFDNCRQCERGALRPGYLIDGQHRTRAMAQPDTTYHKQKIFCSMLSQMNPLGVTLDDAARMFIEINGGAAPLNQLHENFLSSHFKILDYDEPRQRAAYAIAAKLNAPAMQLWSQDTGGTPRPGRITMMPGGADVDFLASWRIEEIVLGNLMGVEVAVPVFGGPGLNSYTPFEWGVNPNHQVDNTCSILRDYLRAIHNTWQGTTGPGTMPAWSTNRNRRGNLQQSGTMRALLRLLPSVIARLREQGNTLSAANMADELALISNVSFNSDWATFMHADSGIDRMERVLERILRTADYGLGGPAWANLHTWAFQEHDPIEIINATASADSVTFATQTTCAMDNTIQTRVSLVGAQSALVTITNVGTGESQIWDGFNTNFRGPGSQTVNFTDLGMTPATAGQDIEVQIQITTPMNNTRIQSPAVIATVV